MDPYWAVIGLRGHTNTGPMDIILSVRVDQLAFGKFLGRV